MAAIKAIVRLARRIEVLVDDGNVWVMGVHLVTSDDHYARQGAWHYRYDARSQACDINCALQQNLSRGDVSMPALSQAAARLRAVDLSSAGDISGAVYDSA